MSKHYPWFKFNPADWLTNIDLRLCSCAARGTLVDLMCLAHRHESYGTIMSFDTPSDRKKIAKSLSISIRTFDKHLADLLQMQRICVSNDGHMYIKRMINDHAKASKDSKNGSKGGNPAVMGVNPPLNPDKNRVEEKRIEKKTPISPKEGKEIKYTAAKLAEIADRIYKEYPRKVAKQTAIKAIIKVLKNDVDPNVLGNIVIAYAKATSSWPDEEKKYIPHPATWFNAGSWEDDQSQWTLKSATGQGADKYREAGQ